MSDRSTIYFCLDTYTDGRKSEISAVTDDPVIGRTLHDLHVGYGVALDTLKREKAVVDALLAKGNSRAPTRQRMRRRTAERKVKVLTEKQTEAMLLHAEHKGKIKPMAEAAGISRAAMMKRLKGAWKKLGTKATPQPKTIGLPQDRRGQTTLESATL